MSPPKTTRPLRWSVPSTHTLQTCSVPFLSITAFITIWNELIYLLAKPGSSTCNNCRTAPIRLTLLWITIINSGEYLKDNVQRAPRVVQTRKRLEQNGWWEEGNWVPIFTVFTCRQPHPHPTSVPCEAGHWSLTAEESENRVQGISRIEKIWEMYQKGESHNQETQISWVTLPNFWSTPEPHTQGRLRQPG